MSDQPFISVVVPVYNGERFLQACIDSLKNQTYDRYEIIVVDDGSTDGSAALVTPPARLVSTEGRTGAGAARNRGAGEAKGDYLLFTDADVEAPPTWIERTVATIRDQGVKCGGAGYAGPVEDTFVQWFAYEELAWRRRNYHGEVDTLVSNNMFCERALFKAMGGFPTAYRVASLEDMEFSWAVSREHTLWWDKDNGVYHNFSQTVKAYLRQQSRFARDTVPMVLGNRSVVGGKTHHPRSFYLEVFLTGLAVLLALLLQPLPALACALAVLALGHGLLRALYRKCRPGYVLKGAGLILVRNVTIILGAIHGVILVLLRKT